MTDAKLCFPEAILAAINVPKAMYGDRAEDNTYIIGTLVIFWNVNEQNGHQAGSVFSFYLACIGTLES
jgi:hypothetical protein